MLAFGATLLGGLACNDVSFYIPPPDFRGITIPLPPPSLVDAPTQVVDLEGTIGHDPGAGTLVFLWVTQQAEGAVVGIDQNGDFEFIGQEVTVGATCLELYYQYDDGNDLLESAHAYYEVILGSGEACTDDTSPCSQTDDDGNCACLDYVASGC